MAGKENTHERHDELVEADLPLEDEFRAPPNIVIVSSALWPNVSSSSVLTRTQEQG